MKFCTDCNQERPGDNRFCTTCGSELTERAAGQPPGPSTETYTIQRTPAQAPEDQPYQPPAWGSASAADAPDAYATQTMHGGSPGEEAPSPAEASPTPTQPGQYADYGQYQQPGQPADYGQRDQAEQRPPAGPHPPAGPYSHADQHTPPDGYPSASPYPPASPYASPAAYQPPAPYAPPAAYAPPAQYQEWPGYQEPGQYQSPGFPPEPGAEPYSPAQGVVPGLGPGPEPRQRSGGGRAAAIVLAAIVIVLAAGAGAYAVVSSLHHSRSTATPPTQPATTSAPAPTTPAPTTASPTPPPTPTKTVTGLVAFAPGVASNAKAQPVENLFTTYFTAINSHNYSQYLTTLDAGMQANNPQSKFDSGYATTSDSNEKINSITTSGSGLTVVITFTSHQAPADSPDQSACNNYNLTLPLVPQGPGYVITTPPPHYASYTDC